MEDAIQSSVYVSSPEFAGWLTKRGFAVRRNISLIVLNVYFCFLFVVAKIVEEEMGRFTWQ